MAPLFSRLRSTLLLLTLAANGCAHHGLIDPAFPVTLSQADTQLRHFRDQRVALERPLVVVGGFLDPFLAEVVLLHQLGRYLDDDAPRCGVSFVAWDSFDGCRRKLIDKVQRSWPSNNEHWTTEVDVLAFSMGGLVARHAALPLGTGARGPQRRLKINRLFTIASPHRGANWAPLGVFNPLAQSMKKGSTFLERLDAALPAAPYTLLPYVRRGDWIVGADNAAPPDRDAWRVAARPLRFSHLQAVDDRRILADVLRRLNRQPGWGMAGPRGWGDDALRQGVKASTSTD